MARLVLILTLLTRLIAAQPLARAWFRGTLFREYRQGNYQVYEIVTDNDATARSVIVLKEERKEGFRRIQIKPGEPMLFALDGNGFPVA